MCEHDAQAQGKTWGCNANIHRTRGRGGDWPYLDGCRDVEAGPGA
jgi:hypothetical protein